MIFILSDHTVCCTYQVVTHRDQTGPEVIRFHATFLLLQGEERRGEERGEERSFLRLAY